ncbi:MAG: ABC transporter ATP-binding protein [Acidimicrobiales bacterium]
MPAERTAPLLEASCLQVNYGEVPAVRDVTMEIRQGEAVAVLGRNGAGKTTTLRTLAGLMAPGSGRVSVDGRDVSGTPAESRVGLGICLVPEGRGIFPALTVGENLAMGAFHRRLSGRQVRSETERVTERFPRLTERLAQAAGSLSGGEQQMLAVARGLMSKPRVLLLDEPSLGLAPIVVEQLYDLLGSLRADGLTMVVVEQYVELALDFADRAYVLDKGVTVMTGQASELAASPQLIEVYMASVAKDESLT